MFSSNQLTFLLKVFANLIVQLGITYWVFLHASDAFVAKYKWPLIFAPFILIIIMVFIPMPKFVKLFLFSIFSATFGLLLSVNKSKFSPATIDIAIKGALAIFGVMFAIGLALFTSGIYLSKKVGLILFWGLIVLILAQLVSKLASSSTNKYLSFAGLLLFAAYVLYDTNKILRRNKDFIDSSMDYYLDILNLFSDLLNTND